MPDFSFLHIIIGVLISVVSFLSGVGLIHLKTSNEVSRHSVEIQNLKDEFDSMSKNQNELIRLVTKMVDQNNILVQKIIVNTKNMRQNG